MAEEEKPSLVEQYELPDSSFDPELDGETLPAAPAGGKATSQQKQVNKPKHSRRIAQMARDLGLSEEEIEANTPEGLEDLVYHLNKQALLASQARSERQAAPVSQEAKPAEEDDDRLDLDETAFDPDLVKALKGIKRESARRVKELEKELAGLKQSEGQRHLRTNAEHIDAAFADLGNEKLFGKGQGIEMDAGDLAFQRRKMVLLSLDQNPPRKSKGLRADVKQRAKELFGAEEAEESAREEKPRPRATNGRYEAADREQDDLAARKREWAEGAVARPTQRAGSPEPKGVRRAEKAAASYLRDKGIKPEDFDGIEEAGLPD